MEEKIDISEKKMASILRSWAARELVDGRKIETKIDGDWKLSRVDTSYVMSGQRYCLSLWVEEHAQHFHLHVEGPWNVRPERVENVLRTIDRINERLPFGELVCGNDGDVYFVQYSVGANAQGGQFTLKHMDDLIDLGARTLDRYGSLLATVALTNTSAKKAWSKFLEQHGLEAELSRQGTQTRCDRAEVVPPSSWEKSPAQRRQIDSREKHHLP